MEQNNQEQQELSRTTILSRQAHYLSIVISYQQQQLELAQAELAKIHDEMDIELQPVKVDYDRDKVCFRRDEHFGH